MSWVRNPKLATILSKNHASTRPRYNKSFNGFSAMALKKRGISGRLWDA